jgi:hypothetical protein
MPATKHSLAATLNLPGNYRTVSKLIAIPHGNERYHHALSTASREVSTKYGDDDRAGSGK